MENIIEKNILIALFMGAKYEISGRRLAINELWIPNHGTVRWDTIEAGRGQTIHYHDSWDWLMPVVEKIDSIHRCEVIFSKFVIEIYMGNIRKSYCKIGTSKIEAVYNAVAEFIKWHNNGTLSYNKQK